MNVNSVFGILSYYRCERNIASTGVIRTVHNEHDPLADCRRNAIGRDAEVSSHMQPVHPGDVEHWTFHIRHWYGNTAHAL